MDDIRRLNNITKIDFNNQFLSGIGNPLIVTDACNTWKAKSTWSFDFFKKMYGEDMIYAQFNEQRKYLKVIKLAEYIDYLDNPGIEPTGFWCTPELQPAKNNPSFTGNDFLYLLDWTGFRRHKELLNDVAPFYFTSDWTRTYALRKYMQRLHGFNYWSIYIGPAGTVFPLHADFGHTFGSLTQICGRKSMTLFAPTDSQCTRAYNCILNPGETLVIPPNWQHQVKALDKSITVSHNFMNHKNAHRHLLSTLQIWLKRVSH